MRNQNWRRRFLSYWYKLWSVKLLERREFIYSHQLEKQCHHDQFLLQLYLHFYDCWGLPIPFFQCLSSHSPLFYSYYKCYSLSFIPFQRALLTGCSHTTIIFLLLVFLSHKLKNMIFIPKTFQLLCCQEKKNPSFNPNIEDFCIFLVSSPIMFLHMPSALALMNSSHLKTAANIPASKHILKMSCRSTVTNLTTAHPKPPRPNLLIWKSYSFSKAQFWIENLNDFLKSIISFYFIL